MKRLRSVQSIKVRVNFYEEEDVYFELSHPGTDTAQECLEIKTIKTYSFDMFLKQKGTDLNLDINNRKKKFPHTLEAALISTFGTMTLHLPDLLSSPPSFCNITVIVKKV